jgi:hypothetical protein
VAQLGAGLGSSYPEQIDTIQTFVNAPTAGPDSNSRVDAEVVNDKLRAIRQIETALGANPQGNFGSLSARLQQFLPGGGATPLFFGFTNETTVEIPGVTHNLGTATPLVQLWDANTPRAAIEPSTGSVDQNTYNVVLTFATPQSGAVSLAAPSPQYTTTFTNQATVTVPGATHLLGSADLLVRVYTVSGTLNVFSNAAVTIATGTNDVVVTFATAQSGSLILSNAGPRYATNFTTQTTVTVPGTTHGLPTPALLFQVYNAANPHAVIRPNSLTVDPTTFDVVMTFVTPQSGRLLLVQASEITGSDFEIRDAGVTNSSAVRVLSNDGALVLQMGTGEAVNVLNKTGTVVQTTNNAGNLAITGTATKPGGGTWLSPSDRRLKEQVEPFTDGLESLLSLMPVWFRYNGLGGVPRDGRWHSGFLAQDVEPVVPYMIQRTRGKLHYRDAEAVELLTFDAEAMLPLLVNTIKALHAELASLHTRVLALEAFHTYVEPEASPPEGESA